MAYRVYCGIAANHNEYLTFKARWGPRIFPDLDNALSFAFKMEKMKKTPDRPWEIEGDDGTRFDREKLKQIFRDRETELAAGPKLR
jgi:hypothetical protein